MRTNALSGCAVFFDFDNTITHFDVLDNIVETFSIDKKWVKFEDAWKKGRIGSKECLSGQLRSVRVDKKELENYLSKIKIDPYFKKIITLLKKSGVKPVIVSDSFSLFLKNILNNNGIRGIKIYCNKIRSSGKRLIPSFPHQHKECPTCGNCKFNHISKKDFEDKTLIYVGDGLSDLCPAKSCDIVFAKGTLKNYLTKEGKDFLPFNNLRHVYDYMRRMK